MTTHTIKQFYILKVLFLQKHRWTCIFTLPVARPLKELPLHQPSFTYESSERAGSHQWLLSRQAQSCVSLVLWSRLLWPLWWSTHVIPVTWHSTLSSLALALSPRPFPTVSYKPWVGVRHVLFMSGQPIVIYYLYFDQLRLSEVTTDHCKILQLFRSKSLKASINLIVVWIQNVPWGSTCLNTWPQLVENIWEKF